MNHNELNKIINRISAEVFGTKFSLRVERDNVRPDDGRFFLQVRYEAKCNSDGTYKEWGGRKWYLSDFMTEDEIVKTAWCAFEAVVKHETMEGFKVDGKILFNPHTNFESLLTVTDKEITRDE